MTKPVLDILRIARWPNLIIAAITQILYVLIFLSVQGYTQIFPEPISILPWILLTTLSIMAVGYIHNDLNDQETDQINRPERITIIQDYSQTFWQRTMLGLLILAFAGLTFTYAITRDLLLIIGLLLPAMLLFFYNTTLKHLPVIGNILIAILCAWIPGILLLYAWPVVNTWMPADHYMLWAIPAFAFLVTWWRELIKDIEDMPGDSKANSMTLPNMIGQQNSLLVSQILAGSIFGALLMWFIIMLVDFADEVKTGLALVALIAPLIYLMYLSFRRRMRIQHAGISPGIKLYMAWGIIVFSALRWVL